MRATGAPSAAQQPDAELPTAGRARTPQIQLIMEDHDDDH